MSSVDKFLQQVGQSGPQVCLVHGDLVLAEPAAVRVAETLAAAHALPKERVELHRHPSSLAPILQDLRTYSLFGGAKVLLALDTAVFADRNAAAGLIDDAAEVLPLNSPALGPRERQAASRLLQALHLFGTEALSGLPAWAFEGDRRGRGGRARGKKQVEELRANLAPLLEAAVREGIQGIGEGDLAELTDAVRGGLPDGHALVLAERSVAADHPLVRLLEERGAVLSVGSVESERGGWQGLEPIAEELQRQTGVAIASDALSELARRTLRQEGEGRNRVGKGIDADSTARLAGEYRKLANLAQGAGEKRIGRNLVEQNVEDRGEEDVWQLLDAVATGRPGEALDRLRRLLASSDDPLAARLSFFSLFASFCRQLTAIRGMMRAARVPAGESNFGRFRDRLAPSLQGELPGGGKNPLAGIHPFRLHRAYLAASRLPEPMLARLPSDVLETELQIKGESGEADAALADLVARVAAAGR
ncbi:MAG: DNA polymerase III subunit delta [Thermoanaerobaculia bacterium]